VSYCIEDGDYVKIDNATIGLRSARSALGGSTNTKNVRVYVSGRNC
jgi:hypothetical protein